MNSSEKPELADCFSRLLVLIASHVRTKHDPSLDRCDMISISIASFNVLCSLLSRDKSPFQSVVSSVTKETWMYLFDLRQKEQVVIAAWRLFSRFAFKDVDEHVDIFDQFASYWKRTAVLNDIQSLKAVILSLGKFMDKKCKIHENWTVCLLLT